MYKTTQLDVSKDLELDDPGYFAKIIPIAYLPNRVHLQIAEKYSGVTDASTLNVQTEIITMYDLMRDAVVDWNLTDANGDVLPAPRMLGVEENRKVCGELPLAIIQYIFEKCMEDTGEIPPVKPSESEPPLSLGLLAEDKPNDLQLSLIADLPETPVPMQAVASKYNPRPQH